jgi:Asp/Glu/hydantoin racemase
VAPQPVFGIQESGVLSAMARADLFGVIAIAEASIARHRRTMARMGVLHRLAGEVPLGMSVDESARGTETLSRLIEAGKELKARGAGAIILGCAGMARHRSPLEAELGIPVIDPTQSAAAMALGALLPG